MADSFETAPFIDSFYNQSTVINSTPVSQTIHDYSDEAQGGGFVMFVIYCGVFAGLFGTLGNGLVLVAMLDNRLRKQTSNVLITNQVSLDCLACLSMCISYAVKIPLAYDAQTVVKWGDIICIILFVGDTLFYMFGNAAAVNLAMIALERYFKIVHSIGHRNHFRRWMLYIVIGFTLTCGFSLNLVSFWVVGINSDGVCDFMTLWPSETSREVFVLFDNCITYILVMVVLCYCYGRIVGQMRKQLRIGSENHSSTSAAVNDSHPSTSNAHKNPVNGGRVSVVKTMIIVSASYGVTTFPGVCTSIILSFDPDNYFFNLEWVYFVDVALMCLNLCLDPFIYALSHDAVKKKLACMFCRKPLP